MPKRQLQDGSVLTLVPPLDPQHLPHLYPLIPCETMGSRFRQRAQSAATAYTLLQLTPLCLQIFMKG